MGAIVENIKVGQDITIVSKGVQHSPYSASSWVDETQLGATSFMRVTKIGTKYVYGVHFWLEDGERKNAYYESKVDIEEYLIFKGVRKEFDEKHKQFRRDLEAYDKLRDETRRKLERKLHDRLNAKMDKWQQLHPRPKPIDLAKLN